MGGCGFHFAMTLNKQILIFFFTVLKKSVKSITSRAHWKSPCSPYTVQFTREHNIHFSHNEETKNATEFGEMELVDCYDEKYLVANSILNKGN